MEYEIIVNAYGNIGVYQRFANGKLRFWSYARTVEDAVTICSGKPTMIIVKGKGR